MKIFNFYRKLFLNLVVRKESGLSILEVMMIVGVSSIAMMGLLNLMNLQAQNRKTAQYQLDYNLLQSTLTSVLSIPSVCGYNFGSVSYTGSQANIHTSITQSGVPTPIAPAPTPLPTPSHPGVVGTLQINQIYVEPTPAVFAGGPYYTNLVLSVQPHLTTSGQNILGGVFGINAGNLMKIPIIIPSSGPMKSCYTQSTAGTPTPVAVPSCTGGQVLNGNGSGGVGCYNPFVPVVTVADVPGSSFPSSAQNSIYSLECPPGLVIQSMFGYTDSSYNVQGLNINCIDLNNSNSTYTSTFFPTGQSAIQTYIINPRCLTGYMCGVQNVTWNSSYQLNVFAPECKTNRQGTCPAGGGHHVECPGTAFVSGISGNAYKVNPNGGYANPDYIYSMQLTCTTVPGLP